MKILNPMVYSRMFNEGKYCALCKMKESDCTYCGLKRDAWVSGFRSVEDVE